MPTAGGSHRTLKKENTPIYEPMDGMIRLLGALLEGRLQWWASVRSTALRNRAQGTRALTRYNTGFAWSLSRLLWPAAHSERRRLSAAATCTRCAHACFAPTRSCPAAADTACLACVIAHAADHWGYKCLLGVVSPAQGLPKWRLILVSCPLQGVAVQLHCGSMDVGC